MLFRSSIGGAGVSPGGAGTGGAMGAGGTGCVTGGGTGRGVERGVLMTGGGARCGAGARCAGGAVSGCAEADGPCLGGGSASVTAKGMSPATSWRAPDVLRVWLRCQSNNNPCTSKDSAKAISNRRLRRIQSRNDGAEDPPNSSCIATACTLIPSPSSLAMPRRLVPSHRPRSAALAGAAIMRGRNFGLRPPTSAHPRSFVPTSL